VLHALQAPGRTFAEFDQTLDELAGKGVRMVPTVFVGDKYVAGFRPTSLLEILPS
jgi:hypothetical protein